MSLGKLKEKLIKIIPTRTTLIAFFISVAIAWFPFMSLYKLINEIITKKLTTLPLDAQAIMIVISAVFFSLIAWRWDVIFKYFLWRKAIKKSWPLIILVVICLLIKDHDLVWRVVESALCFIFIEIYLVWNFSDKENKIILDSPIEKLEDDKLGRRSFVQQVTKIIEMGEYSRIAVEGAWGSGKTSCMNMIASEINNKQIVRYSPWLYRNKEEAWAGFINAIDEGLGKSHKIKTGPLCTNWILRTVLSGLEQLFSQHKYGQLFNLLFMARLKGTLDETKNKVETVLKKEFGEEKIVVFIDDIDRAEPGVVLEMLMLIKEVMDLKNCIFICGIDWEETQAVLRKQYRQIDPEAYLRKIYQLKIPVPEYKAEFSEMFIKSILQEKVCGYVKKHESEIMALLPYFGGTPRQIKEYVYEMNALEVVLESRYSKGDFNWKAMYFAGWLKFRFFKATQEVLKNDLFEYWDSNIQRAVQHDQNRDKFLKKHFDGNQESKMCFHKLMDELMRNKYRVGGDPLFNIMRSFTAENETKYYFRVFDFPETLTWTEYHKWKALQFDKLVEVLLAESEPLVKRKEFMEMLIREREKLLDEARMEPGAVIVNDPKIEEIVKNLKLLKKIVVEKSLVEKLMKGELYKQWIRSLWQWNVWGYNQSWYQEIRSIEKDIAYTLTNNCLFMASEVLNGPLKDKTEFERLAGQDILWINEFYEKFEEQLALNILARLEVSGGIREYQNGLNNGAELKMLFQKDSQLYVGENRERIEKLCMQSLDKPNISMNIYYLFLGYSAVVGANLVFEDDALRELFWKTIVIRKMGTPWVGDLLKRSKEIIEQFGFDGKAVMPVPDWMKENDYVTIVRQHRPEQLAEQS